MNQAAAAALSEAELAVVRATESKELADLNEDELLDLHAQVRRARNKYVGQYRRQGAAAVPQSGGRGKARTGNQRAREKAEVFEEALAKVSSAVARAARRSAAELKTERLAAARAVRGTAPAQPAAQANPATPPAKRPPRKTTGRIKQDASSVAAGARRQAKRDAR